MGLGLGLGLGLGMLRYAMLCYVMLCHVMLGRRRCRWYEMRDDLVLDVGGLERRAEGVDGRLRDLQVVAPKDAAHGCAQRRELGLVGQGAAVCHRNGNRPPVI